MTLRVAIFPLKFLLIFHQNSPLPPLRHAWPLLAWGRGWEIFLTSNLELEKDGWFLFMNRWFLYNIWSKENICAYDIIYIIHIYTKSFILFLGGQIVRLASCSNTTTLLFRVSWWFWSICWFRMWPTPTWQIISGTSLQTKLVFIYVFLFKKSAFFCLWWKISFVLYRNSRTI